MSQPYFSILIPTRNRYETLPYSIRTAGEQDFDSFEVIISDNSSPAQYRELSVNNQFSNDPRIKYIRPESELPMSDHWEFAVSKAQGQYIIIFGDDDGLVPGALKTLYEIFEKTKVELLSWARAEYNWPDRMPVQYSNQLVLPYVAKTGMIESERFIKKIISYEGDYRYLPMFYNSAISRKLVNRLIEKTGRVFNAFSPDIYTGYAFAYLSKKYISIGYPLSVNGVSSKSNGAAHSNNDKVSKESFTSMYLQSGIQWPAILPGFYTSYMGIIEPFIQLSRFFPELEKQIKLKSIFKIIIDTLELANQNDLDHKINEVLNTAAKDKNLHNWVVKYIEEVKPSVKSNQIQELDSRVGFDGSYLTVDASNFKLENVYDVASFIPKLFGEFKEVNYFTPVERNLFGRIKRAVGILLKGV